MLAGGESGANADLNQWQVALIPGQDMALVGDTDDEEVEDEDPHRECNITRQMLQFSLDRVRKKWLAVKDDKAALDAMLQSREGELQRLAETAAEAQQAHEAAQSQLAEKDTALENAKIAFSHLLQKVEKLEAAHELELKEQETAHQAEVKVLEEPHQAQLVEQETAHQAELAEQQTTYQAQLTKLEKERAALQDKAANYQKECEFVENLFEKAKESSEQEVAQLRQQLDVVKEEMVVKEQAPGAVRQQLEGAQREVEEERGSSESLRTEVAHLRQELDVVKKEMVEREHAAEEVRHQLEGAQREVEEGKALAQGLRERLDTAEKELEVLAAIRRLAAGEATPAVHAPPTPSLRKRQQAPGGEDENGAKRARIGASDGSSAGEV